MSSYLEEKPLQTFHSLDEIYNCLKKWSDELGPKFILKCEKKATILAVKIFENYLGEAHFHAKIKIKEGNAEQKYEYINTSPEADILEDGYLDRVKKHTLTILGKDPKGNSFQLNASSSYDSYDARKFSIADQTASIDFQL